MAWRMLFNANSAATITHEGIHHAAHNGAVRSNHYVGVTPIFLTFMNASRRPIMVTLAGQPQGWPVPFIAGSANPVNVTAPIDICTSSGDSLNQIKEAAIMAKSAQSQIVILPYVSAVDPESIQLGQWLQETENRLLDRVKAALDEAGVAWIDPRTKERSKPAAADSVEGSDNAQ
ncbi:ash family protein [Salmonella enterica]|nr:ash family protein [Salmonella enterica]EGY4499150.1 ash family protein [Salmonella enterica]EGY4581114.1 ash family protein [Salmonella enterica]EGY4584720.1 ash family protein [Salmonella enterica]EGY4990190.1 ash family protein [Salmonella enterica]